MAVLAAVLLIGTLAYMGWRWRTTSLRRTCRWRRDAGANLWRCAYCGGTLTDARAPRRCVKDA